MSDWLGVWHIDVRPDLTCPPTQPFAPRGHTASRASRKDKLTAERRTLVREKIPDIIRPSGRASSPATGPSSNECRNHRRRCCNTRDA